MPDAMPTTISDALDILNEAPPSKSGDKGKSEEKVREPEIKLDLEEDDESSDNSDEELDSEQEGESDSEGEEENEEKEEELKVKDEDDEELELSQVPKRQEIKKKYPEFFKDFPQVERVMYREQQYSEIFPSISAAKDAADTVQNFKAIEQDLMSGHVVDLFKQIHRNNPEAFRKISDNLYENLVSVDKDSGNVTANKILKGTLKYLHDFSANALKRNPNDDYADQLRIATQIVHRAMYNDAEVTGPEVLRNQNQQQEDPERKKFESERKEFEETRFRAAYDEVSSRIDSVLTRSISENIDKNNVMTDYMKKNVVKDCMTELNRELENDKRFKDHVNRLWMAAKAANFSNESKQALRKALLSKAQSVLPGIMKAKKAVALKGMGSARPKKVVEEEKDSPKRNTGSREAPKEKLTSTKSSRDSKYAMRPGESAVDYMLREIS